MASLIHVLATYRAYDPSLNPIGWESAIALVSAIVVTILCSNQIPERLRKITLFTGPILLLLATVGIPGSLIPNPLRHRYVVADMSDFAAIVVLLGFGYGLALVNNREKRLIYQINGRILTIIYGCHILWYATIGLSCLLWGIEWPAHVLAGVYLSCHIILATRQYCSYCLYKKRAEQNLCIKCKYDLRGSVGSAICPECGYLITSVKSDNTHE